MGKKPCFVKTWDDDVKKALIEQGFEYIGQEDGMYVFLNDGNVARFECDEVIQTDVLHM